MIFIYLFVTIIHYKKEENLSLMNQKKKIGNLVIIDLACEFSDIDEKDTNSNIDNDKAITYVYFVRKYDKDYLNVELENKFFLSHKDSSHNIRLEFKEQYNNIENPVNYQNFKSKYKHHLWTKKLRQTEKSLCLKHYEACRIISEMDIEFGLIIEDDIVFCDNFMERLKLRMKLFPSNWDIYFPNSADRNGFGRDIEKFNKSDQNLNYTDKIKIKNAPNTVYLCSYLITKNAAQKISNEIEKNKFLLPADHEFNWVFYNLKFLVIHNRHSSKLTLSHQSGFSTSVRGPHK